MDTTLITTLIKKYEAEFLESSEIRMSTSTGNKGLHEEMIKAITSGNYSKVEYLLNNAWYRKPLEGVVYCMYTNFKIKGEFLDAMLGDL